MKITINNYVLFPKRFIAGTKGSYGIEKLEFLFDKKWEGLVKKVTFCPPEGDSVTLLIDNEPVAVPYEVMSCAGLTRYHVSGYSDEQALITVSGEIDVLSVDSDSDGENVAALTPSEGAQILLLAENALKTAKSVREDADAGVFNGEKGDPGASGTNGTVFDTVEVRAHSAKSGGSEITVFAEEGTEIEAIIPEKDRNTEHMLYFGPGNMLDFTCFERGALEASGNQVVLNRTPAKSAVTSGFINLKAGKEYEINISGYVGDEANCLEAQLFFFSEKGGRYISSQLFSKGNTQISVPEGANYVRCVFTCARESGTIDEKTVRSYKPSLSAATEGTGYIGITADTSLYIRETNPSCGLTYVSSDADELYVRYIPGKRGRAFSAVCVGSSLTNGIDGITGYPARLAALMHITARTLGTHGATLTKKDESGTDLYSIITGGASELAQSDIIIVECPLEDVTDLSVALGDEGDSSPDTYCGALAGICQYLSANYAGKPVVFLSQPDGIDHTDERYSSLDTYLKALSSIAAKYGMTVLDLSSEFPVRGTNLDALESSGFLVKEGNAVVALLDAGADALAGRIRGLLRGRIGV